MDYSNPEMAVPNPFQSLKVRYIILQFLGISLLVGFVIGILAVIAKFNIQSSILQHLISILVIVLLTASVWQNCQQRDVNFNYIIGRRPSNHWWALIVGIAIVILLFSLGSFYLSYYPISFIYPTFVRDILTEKLIISNSETSTSIFEYLLGIANIVVVAPICEEFLFRGIILQRWASKWGIRPAILFSSLLFGILHANFVGLSMFGLMMSLLYIKSRTLIVPIMVHALNNAIATGLNLLSTGADPAEKANILEQFRADWKVGVLYVCLSAPWLIFYIYKSWPKKNGYVPYFTNASQAKRTSTS